MKGNTLIETLIYISLLAILMIGVFSSVYMLIGSTNNVNKDILKDSNILLQKYHE